MGLRLATTNVSRHGAATVIRERGGGMWSGGRAGAYASEPTYRGTDTEATRHRTSESPESRLGSGQHD